MELSPVGHKGGVIGRLLLEQDIVEPGFQVHHTYPLRPAQLRSITPSVVELVLILISTLVYRNNVLADPVRLTRLLSRHQQQRRDAPRLLMGQDGANHPLRHQLIEVDVQPSFLLRAQSHRFRLDGGFVP